MVLLYRSAHCLNMVGSLSYKRVKSNLNTVLDNIVRSTETSVVQCVSRSFISFGSRNCFADRTSVIV